MTNYEILMKNDMLAAMEERMHKGCRGCFNYENCGEHSQEACKAMWKDFFKGADTLKKLAERMCIANDCTECPASGICGDSRWECVDTIIAWLKSENVLYDIAIGH